MKTTFSPIISAEKGTTCGPFDQGGPVYRTQLTFTLAGLTAHAIEQAQRASFYGIHGNNPEAAQALPTTGRDGYRATITITADHLTREI